MIKIFYYLLLALIIACNFIGTSGCMASSEEVEKNIQNIKKVKVGMPSDEALSIMGDPIETRLFPHFGGRTVYFYNTPFGASEWIHFTTDSASKVIEVIGYGD